MIYLAALLTGLGGLLVEMVLVRRHGALLGNTAEAAAVVLALFLLGLGVGGLLVARLRLAAGRGPRWWAAVLYGAVGIAIPVADFGLRGLGAVPWSTGLLAALIAPGLLAVGMGAAFPLLFALHRGGPWRSGALIGANLAGSVAAAWLGGNVWIPELGMTWTTAVAAACYLAAAAVLWGAGRILPGGEAAGGPRRRLPFAAGAAPAFASGALVLGLQVVLLRRLPFWLEGFQPTLSGVVAACLLGLTAGAALGTGVLHRLFGRRAAYVALAVGAVIWCLGLYEWTVPALARLDVRSDAGLHLRIAAAAAAAALVPCFFLGSVVPLLVGRLRHQGSRGALAGRLFFWQGVGALFGALWAGVGLPAVFPVGYFAIAPGALAVAALLPCWWRGGAAVRWAVALGVLACLGVGAAGTVFAPRPPFEGARYDRPGAYRYLAHRVDSGVCASVVYDRRNHSMLLFTDGFRAAETGPGTAYMKALGHLPLLLRDSVRRVAVIALGTGTTAAAVTVWPDPESVDVVEISPAVLALVPFYGGDGPVLAGSAAPAFLRDARTTVHLTDGRRYLARHEPGTLDLVTLEPLLPYAPGTVPLYTAEFYELVRRALSPDGLIVQWVPTHAMPRDHFETLLGTFAAGFPHASAWLLDQSTILVGSLSPHLPTPDELKARFAALPAAVSAALHETGLGRAEDLLVALVGNDIGPAFPSASVLRDDRPSLERIGYWSGWEKLAFLPDNLELLQDVARVAADGPLTDARQRELRLQRLEGLRAHALVRMSAGSETARQAVLALSAVRTAQPDSVLLHREETLALRSLSEREVVLRQGQGVRGFVISQLRRDLRSPLLHAVTALPDPGAGTPSRAVQAAAVETVLDLDPLFFDEMAAVGSMQFLAPLRELIPEPPPVSPLGDLQYLPAGEELVASATASGSAAVALRAVFPVRVARAIVGQLAARPLTAAERAAVLPTLDPLSLELASGAIAARGGSFARELYPLWRFDLPMPTVVPRALRGPPAERLELASALRRHRGQRAQVVLATLLMDPEVEVRTAAGISLFELWGDAVPFDPAWDESRRSTAAEQLRSLHNPGS